MSIDFQRAIENALIGFYVSTVEGKFIYANQYMLEIFGYKDIVELQSVYIPEDIYVIPEDRQIFLNKLQRFGYVKNIQLQIKNKNGEILDIILSGSLIDNKIIQGWIVNITEINKLKKQLELNNRIIEENSDAIFITDRNGRIIYTNKKFTTLMGEISENTYAKDFIPVSSEHLKKFDDINRELLSEGSWIGEIDIIGKNNKIISCGVKIFTLKDTKGKIENFISVYRDITEKRELEKQLKHSQKMEILGELASSLIHDMNNILMSLSYNAELIKMVKDNKPEKIDDYLEKINFTIENAQGILNKFSMLSKKSQISKSPIKVSTLVKDLKAIVSTMVKKKNIEINFSDNTEDAKIFGNKSSFIQIILNLVINATDAILTKNIENGLIEVKADIVEIINRMYVRIMVKDNGIGMDNELLSKIYEPFFTTKGDKGTGLGLSIVFKEISELNGNINVSSEPGIGTEFTIIIPVCNGKEKINNENLESDVEEEKNILIYILDDDDVFRESIKEYIEFFGINVKGFSNSEELLKQVKINPPDILILDFILEESITADFILKYLEENNFKFPVLILSGYIDKTISDLKKYENVKSILQKPISGKKLLQKLKILYETT